MLQYTRYGITTTSSVYGSAFLLNFFVLLLLYSASTLAEDKVRVAVLKFGTANWELDVIKRHNLDRAEGFELDVVKLAGKQATMVALQAGDVNIAITDWIWVSRQRGNNRPFTFVPYSTAAGALVVPRGSSIKSLSDLKGKRLGIAGGPVDKSWLLFRALALRDLGTDLEQVLTPVFAAPPLLSEQLKQGRIDAIINFWPYVARLETEGMTQLMTVQEVANALGINSKVPMIGYVFDQRWAAENREVVLGFLHAATNAKAIMKDSDQEWMQLRPLMKATDETTFKALRDGFRSGIPSHWGKKEQEDAGKLFAILSELGGERLVGGTTRLSEGTFWPEVVY
ncbi:MAG: ABC transporter substrate-binding protein [Gammaproteobacteria bacterium]|nr:ABC transporter substrate-binding protein [Gammaproteobacteria bacterium]